MVTAHVSRALPLLKADLYVLAVTLTDGEEYVGEFRDGKQDGQGTSESHLPQPISGVTNDVCTGSDMAG